MIAPFSTTGQIGQSSEGVIKRFGSVQKPYADVKAHFDERFDRVEKRFQEMECLVDRYFDSVVQALCDMRVEMRQLRHWLVGMWVASVAGFGLLLLKEFLFN